MGDDDHSKDGEKGIHWCAILIGVIIVVAIVVVVLALTVFKVRDPKVTVTNVQLQQFTLTLPPSGPMLSFQMTIAITVRNRNYASFNYKDSTAYIYYRGYGIGTAHVPSGKIGSRSTENVVLYVSIDASAFFGSPTFANDVYAGVIPLVITTVIPGKVDVINVVKRHATSSATCFLSIYTQTATVGPISCNYKLSF